MFKMNDLGLINKILGIQIHQDRKSMKILALIEKLFEENFNSVEHA